MSTSTRTRLLVVSHPSVVATNQAVFAELVNQGFDVHLVTPATWVNEYAPQAFDAPTDPVLVGRHTKLAVWLKGRPQRHFYRGSITSTIEAIRPDVIYIEEECFSLAAAQWARAAQRLHIPYGLQAWENLDRPLPALVKRLRSFVLRHASFIVARTPAARTMVEHWGTTADVDVVGCPVPGAFRGGRVAHEGFIVGGAGRLVEQKGFAMVADAVAQIPGATFRLAGDGPLRAELEAKGAEVDTSYTHATMAEFFTAVDVVVLFSTPTATWAEQFGRVLVEAMAQETPVIGSTCGEIPWVIASTGGGIIVEHGDREGLRRALVTLAENPMLRRQLGEAGRRAVEADFSVRAAAEGLANLAQLTR